jgi:hypothetical protein
MLQPPSLIARRFTPPLYYHLAERGVGFCLWSPGFFHSDKGLISLVYIPPFELWRAASVERGGVHKSLFSVWRSKHEPEGRYFTPRTYVTPFAATYTVPWWRAMRCTWETDNATESEKSGMVQPSRGLIRTAS